MLYPEDSFGDPYPGTLHPTGHGRCRLECGVVFLHYITFGDI